MALVLFLRGVNVGGHRSFRPTALADELRHLDVVSIGAAGTFVIRRPATQARLRAEVSRRLPFDAELMICRGEEILRLVSRDDFAGRPERPELVRFVAVLSRKPRSSPPVPFRLPPRGKWLLEVLATDGRFVIGTYRRQLKAIGQLGNLDRLFGAPATIRSWNTMAGIARVLGEGGQGGSA